MKPLFFTFFLALGFSLSPPLQSPSSGILMIGDSMSFDGTVALALSQKLKQAGFADIFLIGSSGSRPRDWSYGAAIYLNKTGYSERRLAYRDPTRNRSFVLNARELARQPVENPRLSDLVKREKPDLIVIQQGTNLLWGLPSTHDFAKEKIEIRTLLNQLFAEFSGKCLWVSPPDSSFFAEQLQEKLVSVLEEEAHGRCQILRSRQHTRYPPHSSESQVDGVHYHNVRGGRAEQLRWTQAIVEAALRLSR